ncbi:hypothetical protein A3L09_05555 [Thermococcus profundus]|uniref:Uncharacterized protein n=1 Tax=Thermococcus profundus TaxID=49899 RepID=A0A2Z2MFS1_THEPR|nr:hypothetical protein [Thermococcus profundus]ASJ02754.1 hypothetical protein A3L09_05555 [Thermococcus profundus]
MRKGIAAFSFLLLFLLLFSYFYLPSKSMSDLYQKIPEQVRRNSQLVAAYYSSQTGFSGFREYQFALYDPEARKIRVYTFKIVKLLKFIPAMRDDVVGCEASFNYSILATTPEELKNFKNCNNCREFLYKGKIYRDGEIESIYPSINEVIKGKENTTYVNLVLTKDEEISTGKIVEWVGDKGILRGPLGYGGLLHLPSSMGAPWRGVILEFIAGENGTIRVVAHYPGNVTLSTTAKVKAPSNKTWTLEEVSLKDIVQKLKSEELVSNIEGSIRFEFSITREDGRIEAWTTWVNPRKGVEGIWRIYPQGKIKRAGFRKFGGYVCTWYGSDIREKLP